MNTPPRFAAYALLLILTACSADDAPARYALALHAESSAETPLAGVRFWVAGRELGPTGDDGRAAGTFSGREGEELRVTALCPVGHRGPSEPRVLKLQRVTAPDGKHASPLALTWRCEPEQARAALVVRTRRGQTPLALPILVDGRVVGQTDAQGIAHVLLHSAAHASLQARLDTSALPDLTPRDPVRVFDLEDSDTILLFDQSFETRKRAAHKPEVRPVRARVPVRIE